MDRIPHEGWLEHLAATIRWSPRWKRLVVLDETVSTQDAAREHGPRVGDVVTTARQTAGRGRLGRAWADTTGNGLATTFVIEAGAPERLAVAAAVGVAEAMQSLLPTPVRIKWPNDVIVGARKVAGILVEQDHRLARIGVGVNVHQTGWAPELATKAVSLRQLGVEIDRVEVLAGLLEGLERSLRLDDAALEERFLVHDVLVGSKATFRCGGRMITGEVRALEPMRGLLVAEASGEIWLPAATTSVCSLHWRGASQT